MKRMKLILFVSLLFLLEGTLVRILLPEGWQSIYWINPRLTLISIIFISLYLGNKEGLWFGLAFGAIYDLVYGSIWGLYLFTYGLIGNLFGLIITVLHRNLWLLLTSVGLGSLFFDLIQYGFFKMFQFSQVELPFIFFRQMVPSSLFNLSLVFLLYPVFNHLLVELVNQKEEREGVN